MTSEEVIAIREKLRLSRKQLVHLLEVPYETLCRWENGKRSPSKFYEAQLRKLSGKIEFPKLEEKWIFVAPNIQRIKNAVCKTEGIMFGTVHGLVDQSESLFLAIVRLRPHARTLNDLKHCIGDQERSPGNQRRRIVGFFISADRQIRPRDRIALFIKRHRISKADHFVIYNKAQDEITVWKSCPYLAVDSKEDSVVPIPYLVVG
jgi:transcriptional regulator with XRE-family HTH domain